jgi:hypothetical protein
MPVTDKRPAYIAIFVASHPGLGGTWIGTCVTCLKILHCIWIIARQIKQTKLAAEMTGSSNNYIVSTDLTLFTDTLDMLQ